ncbi:hypothetical protein CMV_023766 [Castanea mollissima]|uniref:Phosphomannomutase n=1 Tax=Castanea mollissima TaxID=60419 RepID=A0A8J4QJN5_9ROSI|nr:hypothetical protein CMV_023766 [Castanea mollissima]
MGTPDILGDRQSSQDVRTQNVMVCGAVGNIVKSSLGPVGLDKEFVEAICTAGLNSAPSCLWSPSPLELEGAPAEALSTNVGFVPFVIDDYDYAFSENGLVDHKDGKLIGTKSLKTFLGEEKLKVQGLFWKRSLSGYVNGNDFLDKFNEEV